jgi:hypothetical protein
MDPIYERTPMDRGERILRRLARVGVVLALCWAAGGFYLAALLDRGGALAGVVATLAIAPLWLLYAVAGEVLGVRTLRRWTRALRIRIPLNVPAVLHRRVGGVWLLLLAVPAAIALAWLFVEGM